MNPLFHVMDFIRMPNVSKTFYKLARYNICLLMLLLLQGCAAEEEEGLLLITAQPQDITGYTNNFVTLEVGVEDGVAVSFQWQKDGNELAGEVSALLTINNLQFADAGGYSVTVDDEVASVQSDVAIVTVLASIAIAGQPESVTVDSGDEVVFSVLATGDSPVYQWRKNGFNIAGATLPSLTFVNVSASDAGSYDVLVSNGGGEVTSDTAALVINSTQERLFPATSFFYQDISNAAVDANSSVMIQALRNAGGWGNNDLFQIDFSIVVLEASASTPKVSFMATGDFFSPDCDPVTLPLPENPIIEGESGAECTTDGDCHLIIEAPSEDRLYEMWRTNIVGGEFFGGCLAVWDTTRDYGDDGRGQQCTSADAAGFPMRPLLFSADEVAAGEINHAIRFILPNSRIKARQYVAPATHGTRTTGAENAPAYGVHFRLRADFPLDNLPNEGARVVARALQTYGMYHADGGNIALTAQSDVNTAAKWSGLLGSRDLRLLSVEDFEVIDHGESIPVTFDCQRTPLSD